VQEVCDCYLQAAERYQEQGVHTISTDEMTGIQALERTAPTKPMKSGSPEKREYEYRRHGTQCLIANLEVATGTLVASTVDEGRTEEDFAAHVARTVATDPGAGWIFIVDNLNVHQSEALVRYVAKQCCEPDLELGVKGRGGILKSMATRQEFLRNSEHRIRFVYLPKHTSWLNQIECWFSILARRVLKRGSFSSTEELREKILNYIEYHNSAKAKPFKWTFTGRPLNV
jgi:hypothetical protein